MNRIFPPICTIVTQTQVHAERPLKMSVPSVWTCLTDRHQLNHILTVWKFVMIQHSAIVQTMVKCLHARSGHAFVRGFAGGNLFVCVPLWLISAYFVAKPVFMAGNTLLREIVQVPSICFGLWWCLYQWLQLLCSCIIIRWTI